MWIEEEFDTELYDVRGRYLGRWHMGYSEPAGLYPQVGKAMELYPLVLALHEADMEASKILEVER